MKQLLGVLLAMTTWAAGSGAVASIVTYNFQGEWTQSVEPTGVFSGSFSYDTAAGVSIAPTLTNPTAIYPGIELLFDAFDDGQFVAALQPIVVGVSNNGVFPNRDSVQIGDFGPGAVQKLQPLASLFSFVPVGLELTFIDQDGTTLNDTALPALLSSDSFPLISLVIGFDVPGAPIDFVLSGTITSLELQVEEAIIPVPASLPLLLTGFCLAVLKTKRMRQKRA